MTKATPKKKTAAKKPEPKYKELVIAHQSMQFSDPDRAHELDAQDLFRACQDLGVRIVTGTETASDKMWAAVAHAADKADYLAYRHESCWVAVHRQAVEQTGKNGFIEVVPGDVGESQHDHGPRGISWLTYEDIDFGTVTVGAAHQLTRGRRKGDPNYKYNQKFGPAFEKFAKDHGKGPMLCFLNMDGNMSDRIHDVYWGAPFTTAWDDLKTWPATHPTAGNIDVIGGFNGDGRVEWVKAKAYPDSKVYMRADHYLIVATAKVKVLR